MAASGASVIARSVATKPIQSFFAAMAPMLQATSTIPIVFANVADPVGAGFVDSLARL